ncbi:ATP-binding cassette domain-containing protein, partial [Streptomyces sampsonii]|uniref:ATP-binding cassette domain-containing protein n=1 Tax=Streptomyces sampsonii TaxID=42239 RepID=UPI0008F55354
MTPPAPQEPPAGPPTRKALRSLLPVLAAHRAMTARTCAAALVDQAALVALVTLAAHTVGTAVIDGRPPSAATVALLLALVAVRALATWREMDLSHDLAYRVLALLRVRVFDGIARSAPARIAGRRSGDLASTALGDVEALEFFYAHALAQLLATGTVFTASAALLGTREPWLLALVLPAAALLLALPVLDGRGRAARGARTRTALADLSAETVETVDGLRELLAFGALNRRRARLRAYGRRLARAQRAEQSWEAGAAALRDLLVVAAVIGVVAVAGHSAVEGRLHGAWTPAAMALALGALAPVADAAASLGQAGSLRAAAARVRAAAEAPAGAPAPSTPRPLPEGPLGLHLRGVRFGYGSTPVLDGVDLTVRPGETVALVGASGAGKSTCAHLLARYWDPQEGTVTLVPEDGRPPVALRDLADAELRSAVAVVGQEAPLFHGTLAENLLLAAPDAPPDVLDRAVRACGVDVLAAGLPDGLGTAVGERGATLSGGQRARVALARALVAAPRVLVLDETTAHLDHRRGT